MVIPLQDAADAGLVGSKAANLASLLAAGFPVPGGFVVPAAVTSITPEFREELTAALGQLEGPVAVRSSALAEDLAGASFAGLYESVLDVTGLGEVEAAIEKVWASARAERVQHYRGALDQGLAVLVQEMVESRCAGVAFGADPRTGEQDVVIINAVEGLGEKLVSGEADADHWSVRGRKATRAAGPHVLTGRQARRVARLVRRLNEHFGAPQDVEWAMSRGELHVVQSRPITTLPPVPIQVPAGLWEKETAHHPVPPTPMTADVIAVVYSSVKPAIDRAALLLENIEFTSIGGWPYLRVVPLGGKDRPPPPAFLMPLLIRVVPPLRKRIAACVAAMEADVAGEAIARWWAADRDRIAAQVTRAIAVDLRSLTDDQLVAHARETVRLMSQAGRIHFSLHFAIAPTLFEYVAAARGLLAWDQGQAIGALVGASQMSTEPALALAQLASVRSSNPTDFDAALGHYLEQYGHRTMGYEVAEPTLFEQPDLAVHLLDNLALSGPLDSHHPGSATLRAGAEAKLADHPEESARWSRLADRALEAYRIRDDNHFFTIASPLAVMRYTLIEIGERLATRATWFTPDDVFMLTLDEAIAALTGGPLDRGSIDLRRAQHAWAATHPGPATYGGHKPAPPRLAALPAPARLANEALVWYMDMILGPPTGIPRDGGRGSLTGIAASPGTYTGTARVILHETDFGTVKPGDVLVCRITTPNWSVLFPTIGALVTDVGGMLSHAAIIAREFGIPAVTATAIGTTTVTDGQTVTVDGTMGTVTTH